MMCGPACLPSSCICHDGQWGCSLDCAGQCVERPAWTGSPAYVIIDLGTLGGWTSVGLGINESGQVVGGADTPGGKRHAFLWDCGTMQDLGTLTGIPITEAWDINNVGQVVGAAMAHGSAPPHAFLWQNGEMIELTHLGGGESDAFAINDIGQIVGLSKRAQDTEIRAVLWDESGISEITNTLGGSSSMAWDINDVGQVVGSATTVSELHAFLWEEGVMQDLGTLGGEYSRAFGINDLGQVVGRAERAPGGDRIFHAFLWQAGDMIALDAMGRYLDSEADSVNHRGHVVGTAIRDQAICGYMYGPDAGMQELLALLSPNNGWSWMNPRDINDAGQIVGAGTYRGRSLAFLMTPLDGDYDNDNDEDTDLGDFAAFRACLAGPSGSVEGQCKPYDINRDGAIDLVDLQAFQWVFGDPSHRW